MKCKYPVILTALVLLAGASTEAAPKGFDAFSNVHSSTVRMPFYKNNQLDFYVRARQMKLQGKQMEASWPLIDLVKKGISVEHITKAKDDKADIYPLGTPPAAVDEFWAKRLYSSGLVMSENADIDQLNRIVTGKKAVFVRSPMMDLNGVGYTADFNRRVVTVNSQVEIIMRNTGSNQYSAGLDVLGQNSRKGAKKSSGVTVTRAFGDSLTIDIQRRTVTLLGNVRVFDQSGTITSERLDIEFAEDGKRSSGKDDDLSGQKLKLARFSGKVKAVHKAAPGETLEVEEFATADVITFNIPEQRLDLIGSRPRITRGKEFAEADKIEILTDKKIARFYKNCCFEVANKSKPQAELNTVKCDYAEIEMTSNKVLLAGNVLVNAPDENADVSAGKITYSPEKEEVILEHSPVVIRGADKLSGGKMIFLSKQERLLVSELCEIVLSPATAQSANIGTQRQTNRKSAPIKVNSQSADLNSSANLLNFTGKVKVDGRGIKLDCDKLDIFLTPTGKKSSRKKASGTALTLDKKPERALCTGNVRVNDGTAQLEAGVLDLRFGDKAKAGEIAVEKVYASGNVLIKSSPDGKSGGSTLLGRSSSGSTTLKAKRGVLDLLKNQADFYEKVRVSDPEVTLECEHLVAVAEKALTPVPSMESYKANDQFPDRLAVGEDRELKQITGTDKVRIVRKLPTSETQYATGDKADYVVKDRKLVLTANPPKRAVARTAESGMIGDKVVIELDTEDVIVENGDVLARLNEV